MSIFFGYRPLPFRMGRSRDERLQGGRLLIRETFKSSELWSKSES